MVDRIVVGTRGSRLSMTQTNEVVSRLKARFPAIEFDVAVIKTEGDRKHDVPLADIAGDGIFTKDIEDALLSKRVDIAVHSLKDLPTKLHPGLLVCAVTEREDPRDVVISGSNMGLDGLPRGAVVGTESPRRISQLKAYRDDIKILGLRGNVDTRIKKLDNGEYDAIVIAAAGVIRLGMRDRIAQYIPTSIVIPAPGQGALAVETRRNDLEINRIVKGVEHAETRIAVDEERGFLSSLGGGCVVPIASYATADGKGMLLEGMVGDELGKTIIRGSISGAAGNTAGIGATLAGRLLAEGAYRLLEGEIDYMPLLGKKVIVTSERRLADVLSVELAALGAQPVLLPGIEVKQPSDFSMLDSAIKGVGSFDWVIFTSATGVRYVKDRFDALGEDISGLNSAHVAVVGPATAEALRRLGVKIDYMPKRYVADEIAGGLGDIGHKRVLLLRTSIAGQKLAEALGAKGAVVVHADAYSTIPADHSMGEVNAIMKDGGVSYAIFTSASGVESLARALEDRKKAGFSVVSIGPATSDALRNLGINDMITADEHTAEGIIKAILKNLIGA
ncbi:MAG: hydroxymethylbilane synthase [Candidatus Micrarchaeota archaeon]|nr:hydroxymethylbilane synthase [Candidatus Micrarchaeota archaeon]